MTLSAELYETAGNKLIASFNGRGDDVEKLLLLIESKSSEFFREIKDMNAPVATSTTDVIPDEQSHAIPDEKINVISGEKTDVIPGLTGNPLADSRSKVGESIPANVNDEPEKKSGIAGKVVFGISAAATVAGAILAVAGNSQAKKAAERNSDDLHRDLDDAKTGQTLRGVGIGVAIAGAVGIGLSFVF